MFKIGDLVEVRYSANYGKRTKTEGVIAGYGIIRYTDNERFATVDFGTKPFNIFRARGGFYEQMEKSPANIKWGLGNLNLLKKPEQLCV